MSNINSKTKLIHLNSTKMKPSGTSTPLHIHENDSFNISASTSRSSSLDFYENNNKINHNINSNNNNNNISDETKPKIIYHNCTTGTTTTGTSSSININNNSDEEIDEICLKNDYISDSDESDDSNLNNNKMYICNLNSHNRYYILNKHSNLYNNNNNNNNTFEYYDEYAYKKASIELFLNQFRKLVNDFIRENQNISRESLAKQQATSTGLDCFNNNEQTDYFFTDMAKIEKLKHYGNKIFVSIHVENFIVF